MSESAASAVVLPASAEKTSQWQIAFLAAAFILLWLEVVKHVSSEWSVNPQYSYGWAVPFLAIFLLWQRWTTRPAPRTPDAHALPLLIIVLGALLLFPIRFVAEANPDWRLLSWILALSVVTISMSFVYLAGGWPLTRHFIFPFVFFLVAVPWPTFIEQTLIQDLMRAVTAINVSLLNVIGVPALQHGNVIETSSGLIGIEEACSGVRSLQATLMISLFLGELYSFAIGQRIILILSGVALAFVTNVIRTAILVWVGAHRGASSIEAWHDPAGLTILMVCLFGLWSLSLLMRGKTISLPDAVPVVRPRSFGLLSAVLFGIAIWIILVEAGVQLWYWQHQSPFARSRWAVRWPTAAEGSQSIPISPEAKGLLRYDEGGGTSWNGNDGHHWMMYFFRWLPGHTAALFVKIHRPDICLPATGLTLERDTGIRIMKINDVSLPIRSYRFDDHGRPVHVFYCYWDARSSYENVTAAVEENWTPRGRIRAALQGRREIGAQMLEIIVFGYDDDDEAVSALQHQLSQLVNPG